MKTRFYDLQAEEEAKIREAEDRHRDLVMQRELTAIREATQSTCALLLGLLARS